MNRIGIGNNSETSSNTNSVITSESCSISNNPTVFNRYIYRIVIKIVLLIFILLTNHINMTLQNNCRCIFVTGSSRNQCDNISGCIFFEFCLKVFEKFSKMRTYFFFFFRRSGNLCNFVKSFPQMFWFQFSNSRICHFNSPIFYKLKLMIILKV